jgi:sugar lactone lactonase YvrE
VGALLEFDFDEQGSIGFIRYEQEGARAFVLVKPTGEVIHEQCLNTVADPYGAWSTAWLKDDQWIVIHSPGGAEAKSDAWLLDVSARSMTPIEEFDCPAVEAVDGCDDGSFVVLARHRYRYTSTPELIAFDADGRRRWSIKGETPDREGLFSPEDIAVTAGGTIAVIDSIRKVVQLFDKNGKRGRTIDLLKAFGHEPNYPTGIATDTNGGFIVHDFGGSPSNWRLSPDGQVVAKLEPRFADARKLDTDGLKAGLGRLWTTDGHSLFRLTDDGLVDLVVPPLPETDEIAGVAGFTVDHRGLFYVVSTRTGAVHVFDPSGRFLRVMEPLPGDFATNMWAAEMTVAGDGSVFVRESLSFEPGSYLKFSCEGKRIGRLEQSEEVFRQRWHFKPASLQRWIAGYQEVLLVDEGGKRLQTIKRRPDRNWLQRVGPLGVAPDGGVAVSSTNADTFGPGEPAISLYGPQGEPWKTIKLPIADHVLDVAYDGRWIVVSTESGLLVVDSQDGTVRKLTPPATSAHPHWNVFFVPDPPGLLLHEEGTLGVLRYQMPE